MLNILKTHIRINNLQQQYNDSSNDTLHKQSIIEYNLIQQQNYLKSLRNKK